MLQETIKHPIKESGEGATAIAKTRWGGTGTIIQGGRAQGANHKVNGAAAKVKMAALASKSDMDLVKAFQSGTDREDSLVELFERYGQITYAFLRRRIGNPEIAAELNQELYIGVMESLDRFRGDSSFKTWLFRLAHHRLSNQRRRWRTHLDEVHESTPDELVEVLAGDDESPDEAMDRDQKVRVLEKCLAGLTEVQRAVVVGQYYEQITLEDLTKNLKLTNKSGARASLIAAQRKLRRCMEQSGFTASA